MTSLYGVVALETQQGMTQLLNKDHSNQLVKQIALDLSGIINNSHECNLAIAGAAYPVEQILTPGFNIHQQLHRYAKAAFQGQKNQNKILSIGSNGNKMPEGLSPNISEQNFNLVPLIIEHKKNQFKQKMEQELMHKGMVSPPCYNILKKVFRTNIIHANYMTNLDLMAMMHNHYQQVNQTELWQIIETAILQPAITNQYSTHSHNTFYLSNQTVYTPFYTPYLFKKRFPKMSYIKWLMQHRLSINTLETHGLCVRQFNPENWNENKLKTCLGEIEKAVFQQNHYTETIGQLNSHDEVTVISCENKVAGLIYYSVRSLNTKDQTNYYPLNSTGIQQIKSHIIAHFNNILNQSRQLLENI